MNTARLLRLQPLRAAVLKQTSTPSTAATKLRQPILRQTRGFQSSRLVMREKDHEQSAHTITQRLRRLKAIPPELLPLGVVIAFALFAAMFAMGKKLFTDKTLRLHKSKPASH